MESQALTKSKSQTMAYRRPIGIQTSAFNSEQGNPETIGPPFMSIQTTGTFSPALDNEEPFDAKTEKMPRGINVSSGAIATEVPDRKGRTRCFTYPDLGGARFER